MADLDRFNHQVNTLTISDTTSDTTQPQGHHDEGSKKDNRFSDELQETKLTIIEHVTDLGYFSWHGSSTSCKPSIKDVECEDDILPYINFSGVPDLLLPTNRIRTPIKFRTPADNMYESSWPNSQLDIVGMYAAAKRGVHLDDLNFIFGGATLEMLANKEVANKDGGDGLFIATRVPGTNGCILVVKTKRYVKNLADFGFQFERHATGGQMLDSNNGGVVQKMQIAKVGAHRVLFRAEVDAVDAEGATVEIKASNPQFWGTSVLFQMISSGSSRMCHGHKKGGVLKRVVVRRLSRLAPEALKSPRNIERLERNILEGMEVLKDTLPDEGLHCIGFDREGLTLTPASAGTRAVLPPDHVVKCLIGKS